jgi:hypothetical protein
MEAGAADNYHLISLRVEGLFVGDKYQVLSLNLINEHPIEWITMCVREPARAAAVLQG